MRSCPMSSISTSWEHRDGLEIRVHTIDDWEFAVAGGFAKDGAVQDQIDATIEDAVERARSRLPRGASLDECEECGAEIPDARRKAVPGVRLCIGCQEAADRKQAAVAGINRRGSKDSQLR